MESGTVNVTEGQRGFGLVTRQIEVPLGTAYYKSLDDIRCKDRPQAKGWEKVELARDGVVLPVAASSLDEHGKVVPTKLIGIHEEEREYIEVVVGDKRTEFGDEVPDTRIIPYNPPEALRKTNRNSGKRRLSYT
jgi:hypothetical protein